MLTLKNVSAGYNGVPVLRDLNYVFETGKNYCILGPNGCGKTTLVRAIAALIPSTGEIEIDGRSVRGMRRGELAAQVAVMGQVSDAYFPYSVYETVMMGRYHHMRQRLFGLPNAEDREQVDACIESVGLTEQRGKKINTLSGGQRQRVFLARVFAQNPRIVLLDEPTNHLDIRYQMELMEYLGRWTAQGDRSVIGVLHDINLALRMTENVLFIHGGRIVGNGKFSEVVSSDFLREVYETDIVHYMRDSFRRWERIR
ncbi:MAG: ABC transporter ATP-binding protein [Christensenellales bacterium]|nr:ABC transporter ATP-binding protein [Christensenellales bacterium]